MTLTSGGRSIKPINIFKNKQYNQSLYTQSVQNLDEDAEIFIE